MLHFCFVPLEIRGFGAPRTSADARQSDPYQQHCADRDSIQDTVRDLRYDTTLQQIGLSLIIFVGSSKQDDIYELLSGSVF